MSRPYKTTGCFRFFVFLLIFAPAVYLGVSYYHGQNGLENIKNLFQKGTSIFSNSSEQNSEKKDDIQSTSQTANSIIKSQEEKIRELENEISRLNEKIDRLEAEAEKPKLK